VVNRLWLTVAAALAVSLGVSRITADGPARPAASGGDNPAVNAPDKFAWQLFIEVNQPAKDGTNAVLWETWADDPETFPATPRADKPPEWPGRDKRPKVLRPSRQLDLFRRQRDRRFGDGDVHPRIAQAGEAEEVRRNRPTFDFIVANKLWYLDGIAAAYKAGRSVDFPTDAIETKAHWKRITEADKKRFHWNTDGSGQLFGLVALHISSKALPNWFWATFEHVDNPDRGKALGCHDAFGMDPPNSCDGKVSAALDELLTKAGMGPEWRSYRLAGSQTNFTDSTGRPTLLGNSEIEGPFLATSSCITCHAKARADASSVVPDVFKSNSPLEGDVGLPNPDWFYNGNGGRKAMQLDFVWGFLAAQPVQRGK
jgi:hypothetical protein